MTWRNLPKVPREAGPQGRQDNGRGRVRSQPPRAFLPVGSSGCGGSGVCCFVPTGSLAHFREEGCFCGLKTPSSQSFLRERAAPLLTQEGAEETHRLSQVPASRCLWSEALLKIFSPWVGPDKSDLTWELILKATRRVGINLCISGFGGGLGEEARPLGL